MTNAQQSQISLQPTSNTKPGNLKKYLENEAQKTKTKQKVHLIPQLIYILKFIFKDSHISFFPNNSKK